MISYFIKNIVILNTHSGMQSLGTPCRICENLNNFNKIRDHTKCMLFFNIFFNNVKLFFNNKNDYINTMQLQHKHCMCMKVLLILKMRK